MNNSPHRMQRVKIAIPIIVLFILGFLIYSNTLSSPFHFDDLSFIVGNDTIRDIGNLKEIWSYWGSRFTGFLSFALNYHFHQLNVFGYHLVNLFIHICSAVLVLWFVRLTLLTPVMRKEGIPAGYFSFFVALVFLTHPLQTETLNYIFQRVTLLATFFYLAAVCLYAKAALMRENRIFGDNVSHAAKNFGALACYSLSLLSAFAGMLSKEIAFTLPFMILLYDFCFLRTKNTLNYRYILPFFLMLPAIPAVIMFAKPLVLINIHKLLEAPAVNSSRYLLTQFRVVVTYIRLFMFPFRQNLDYDYPVSHSLTDLNTLGSLLFLVAIFLLSLWLSRRYILISFGIFWFFLTLMPESSVIPLGDDVIFEHRLYLPLVGCSIAAVGSVYYFLGRKKIAFAVAVLIAMAVIYSVLTYNRNAVWRDELTLWSDTVNKSPGKVRPYNERGLAYFDKGEYGKAILDFTSAITINPSYADGYYNRGLSYFKSKDYQRAIIDFSRVIGLNDKYRQAYYNRGAAYYLKKEYVNAASDFKQVISLDPDSIDAYYYLVLVYKAMGKSEEALAVYNKAQIIKSSYAQEYYNAAVRYRKSGRHKKAVYSYREALKFAPDDLSLLGALAEEYIFLGNYKDAVGLYKKILEIEPNSREAHNNIALAYYYDKQYNLAIKHIDIAQRLGYKIDPKFLSLIERHRKR